MVCTVKSRPLQRVARATLIAGPALLFGLRLAAAVSAALLVAFTLQLDNPSWAGTSAGIVCQPVLGASLRKGVFRLVGTVVGAVATVLLTSCFPQNRLGFLLGMAIWCAVCSFVATLLRNFAAYAAMLAGYTMAIIASSSIAQPDQVFVLSLSRATEIGVGIVCGMAVMSLTDLGGSPDRLARSLADLVAEIGSGLIAQLREAGTPDERFRQTRRDLIKRTAALDPLIDQTIGESPAASEHRTALQAGLNGLFLALSAWRTLGVHLEGRALEARQEAAALLAQLPASVGQSPEGTTVGPTRTPTAEGGGVARDRDAWLEAARRCRDATVDTPSERLGIDRIASVLEGLARAANAIVLLTDSRHAIPLRAVPRNFLPDSLPALVNAARVFIAVGAAVLFYVVTAWPAGPTFITFLAVTVILQSPRDEAAFSAAVGFGLGMVLTSVLAAVVKFALLPNHESPLSLVLIIGLALVPMAALSTRPRWAPVFIAATTNFIPLLGPTNAISFDPGSFYNTALAIVGGSVAGAVVLRAFPPVPKAIRAQRLLALTLRELRRLARNPGSLKPDQWRSRIFGRLTALPPDAPPVDGSRLLAALTMGLQYMDLHEAAVATGRELPLVRQIGEALQRGAPGPACEHLKAFRAAVEQWPHALQDRTRRLRLQGAAHEMSDTLQSYASFFGAEIR